MSHSPMGMQQVWACFVWANALRQSDPTPPTKSFEFAKANVVVVGLK